MQLCNNCDLRASREDISNNFEFKYNKTQQEGIPTKSSYKELFITKNQ